MATLICQVCNRPLGDRPADVAPGPHGQLWYVHRDVADCARAISKATEPCPVCGLPAEVEHGLIVNDRPAHVWDCRECGEHIGVLCYECPDCERVRQRDMEVIQ